MKSGVLWLLALPLWSTEATDFFENRVRPLLAAKCYACHAQTATAGLRLDSREALLKGGGRGPALVPGDPEASLLLRAVRGAAGFKAMPPGGALASAEVDVLQRWIRDGAVFPAPLPNARGKALWSLQPLVAISSSVDELVAQILNAKGLVAAPPADRRTLIRRLSFDLIGLPPKPDDVDAFVSGKISTETLVDRLLASPHFGERWARHWLDVARFGEDDYTGTAAKPYPNAWRYRDWVIDAFNRDLPYDTFVKAQIAGDLLPDNETLKAGLGLFGLGPWYYSISQPPQARADERHDRVDMIGRGFLGLTVACARCHDHKYDPIRTEDYYALAGVFASAKYQEYPLADTATVARYEAHQKLVKAREAEIESFLESQRDQLALIFAGRLADLLMAVARKDPAGFDAKLYEHWTAYLAKGEEGHPFLNHWRAALARQAPEAELRRLAEEYQALVFTIIDEKKALDQQNAAAVAKAKFERGPRVVRKIILPFGYDSDADFNPDADLPSASLPRDRYVFWHGLFKMTKAHLVMEGAEIERFLAGEFAQHLVRLRAKLAELKKTGPPAYPYLHGLGEHELPIDLQVNVRGNPTELGAPVPRHFPEVLGGDALRTGSGRLELANAIMRHPMAARVMANRVWLHLFGAGLVRTPSNFGTMGERPANPALLDALAARFRDQGWSVKKLIREMVLSKTYQASSATSDKLDPDNRFFARASRRRLDAEALRDSLLAVAGTLDEKLGGESAALEETNRRTVYVRVGRYRQDETLSLFDFPSSSVTSEQRTVTNVPLQRLFFLNSAFILKQSAALAARVMAAAPEEGRIAYAYRLLFQREPAAEEITLGRQFLTQGNWSAYAQVLLSANEFAFID